MSIWVIEENDQEDGPNEDWFPLDAWAHNYKKDASEAATGRRIYLRETKAKRVKVRIREYVPNESQ